VADHAPPDDIDGWVLCGGEARRMGGQDKGLLAWRGDALARHTAGRLAPQVRTITLNANRHLDQYRAWGWPVLPDDGDLPMKAGPLSGMLTGLRHAQGSWLQFCPCDSPALPADLVLRLRHAAQAAKARVAVPCSLDPATGEQRHHWTTVLAHRDTLATLQDLVRQGERRVGQWVRTCAWIGVCFERPADFININTPETLHGTPWQ
jgi:molybdopterin-guanine dinucleotide biosynthesis protein A